MRDFNMGVSTLTSKASKPRIIFGIYSKGTTHIHEHINIPELAQRLLYICCPWKVKEIETTSENTTSNNRHKHKLSMAIKRTNMIKTAQQNTIMTYSTTLTFA